MYLFCMVGVYKHRSKKKPPWAYEVLMDVQNDKQYSEFVKKGRNWHLNIII